MIMPLRKTPLVNGEIYHVFNRGINRQPTFTNKVELRRAINVVNYYCFCKLPSRFSKFLKLSNEERIKIMDELVKLNEKLTEVIALCLMPNHFHFILKQVVDNGISKFVGNFQNSYTRYFNIKNDRDGSLFLDQFKAVRITTDEQLLHVSRYIHLNPLTSFVVKNLNELFKYAWSSLPEYLTGESGVYNKEIVLGFFKHKEGYKQFIIDQADYQKGLHKIEHLILE